MRCIEEVMRRKYMVATKELILQWTKPVIGNIIWRQVLEDVEARNVVTQNIVWKSPDLFGHVVGEAEGRGAITFT